MSKTAFHQKDDKNTGALDNEAPEGQVHDDSYVTGESEPIPVQGDDDAVADPIKETTADSDKALERDEKEAIDKSNIIRDRTRGAKPRGQYTEPDDSQLGLTE
ncbi:uncharacterized protein UV8b_01763 [Ustilaginoidea virens]|uniref:Histone chaperone domain-containing protein n=1 Tax=Ustilaginoidea virens TaxID=1159556 RepID=A0A063BPK8_USTVR|nr:uncharacterized protein UV8b_01763 [Ustilaginoidea virens]QUC17522.1 hypothetical protein UV8b_01763 [Ustilaginoidea virens]GAO13618.1 hypothetical protein UVI_02017270 [Ustilaginoidea virens]